MLGKYRQLNGKNAASILGIEWQKLSMRESGMVCMYSPSSTHMLMRYGAIQDENRPELATLPAL